MHVVGVVKSDVDARFCHRVATYDIIALSLSLAKHVGTNDEIAFTELGRVEANLY